MTKNTQLCLHLISSVPSLLVIIGPHANSLIGYGAGAIFFTVLTPLGDLVLDRCSRSFRKNSFAFHDTPACFTPFSLKTLLYTQVLFCLLALMYSVAVVSCSPHVAPTCTIDRILYTLSVGTVVGITSLCAHELAHGTERGSRTDTLVGDAVMGMLLNPVYNIEHHYHHRDVGTANDSATARFHESFYWFFVRRQFHGWRRAMLRTAKKVCSTRLRNLCGIRDRFINGLVLGCLTLLAIYWKAGCKGARLYLLSCFWGLVLVSMGDYVQHYGVVRRKDPTTGALEPVSRKHSWDNRHLLSNIVLFSAGGHSHHHIDPALSFTELQWNDGVCFPHGVITMGILALIPPAFYHVTDHIVEEAGFLHSTESMPLG